MYCILAIGIAMAHAPMEHGVGQLYSVSRRALGFVSGGERQRQQIKLIAVVKKMFLRIRATPPGDRPPPAPGSYGQPQHVPHTACEAAPVAEVASVLLLLIV